MTNTEETVYRIGDHKLKTGPGYAKFGPHARDGEFFDLTTDEIGQLAEWLAVAWENLAGAPYEPEYVGERVERDCE